MVRNAPAWERGSGIGGLRGESPSGGSDRGRTILIGLTGGGQCRLLTLASAVRAWSDRFPDAATINHIGLGRPDPYLTAGGEPLVPPEHRPDSSPRSAGRAPTVVVHRSGRVGVVQLVHSMGADTGAPVAGRGCTA